MLFLLKCINWVFKSWTDDYHGKRFWRDRTHTCFLFTENQCLYVIYLKLSKCVQTPLIHFEGIYFKKIEKVALKFLVSIVSGNHYLTLVEINPKNIIYVAVFEEQHLYSIKNFIQQEFTRIFEVLNHVSIIFSHSSLALIVFQRENCYANWNNENGMGTKTSAKDESVLWKRRLRYEMAM